MPKQDYYEQGQLTDLVYLVLASLTVPRHGYLIMNKVEEMTGGRVCIGPASLYTTLKKLNQAGLIQLLEDRDNKKVYHITDKGVESLRIEIDKREQYAAIGKTALDKYEVRETWENTGISSDIALQMG